MEPAEYESEPELVKFNDKKRIAIIHEMLREKRSCFSQKALRILYEVSKAYPLVYVDKLIARALVRATEYERKVIDQDIYEACCSIEYSSRGYNFETHIASNLFSHRLLSVYNLECTLPTVLVNSYLSQYPHRSTKGIKKLTKKLISLLSIAQKSVLEEQDLCIACCQDDTSPLPTHYSCQVIFNYNLTLRGQEPLEAFYFNYLWPHLKDFTSQKIEQLIKNAELLALDKGKDEISLQDLLIALYFIKPNQLLNAPNREEILRYYCPTSMHDEQALFKNIVFLTEGFEASVLKALVFEAKNRARTRSGIVDFQNQEGPVGETSGITLADFYVAFYEVSKSSQKSLSQLSKSQVIEVFKTVLRHYLDEKYISLDFEYSDFIVACSNFPDLPLQKICDKAVELAYFSDRSAHLVLEDFFNAARLYGVELEPMCKDKSIPQREVQLPQEFHEYLLKQQGNRFKLRVKNQFDADGGGSASCGYHALKNSLFIAAALQSPLQAQELLANLISPAPISRLFAKETDSWRAAVIEKRSISYLRDVFYNALLLCLRGVKKIERQESRPKGDYNYHLKFNQGWLGFEPFSAEDEHKNDERDAFQSVLINVASTMAMAIYRVQEKIIVPDYNVLPINLLMTFLTRELVRRIELKESKFEILNSEEKINQYFDFQGISPELKLQSVPPALSSYLVDPSIARNGSRGDWLESSEILSCWNYSKRKSLMPDLNNIKLICIEDKVGNVSYGQQCVTNKNLATLIERLKDPESSFISILIVHYPGHWISCVIDKKGLDHCYIITDSNNNSLDLEDTNLLELIAMLNGKVVEQAKDQAFSEQPEFCEAEDAGANPYVKDSYSFSPKKPQLTFDDIVGGIPPKIADLISAAPLIQKHKVTGLNTLLLKGPPGTGKTTLAEAIANALKSDFYVITSSSFITKYQGSATQGINRLFEQVAKRKRRAVIFIDEIDGLANTTMTDSNGEADRAIKALQTQLDKKNPLIFCIVATNHYDKLPEALKDRFGDNAVEIGLPDRDKRLAILKHYIKKHSIMVDEKELENLAGMTGGRSCRFLEKLVSQLFFIAAKKMPENKQLIVDGDELRIALYLAQEEALNENARALILQYFLVKHINMDQNSVEALVAETEGMTGREIEDAAIKSLQKMNSQDMKFFLESDFYVAAYYNNKSKLPNISMRRSLLEFYLEKRDRRVTADKILQIAEEATDDFTGQELETMVDNAFDIARRNINQNGEQPDIYIENDDLYEAFCIELAKKAKPHTVTNFITTGKSRDALPPLPSNAINYLFSFNFGTSFEYDETIEELKQDSTFSQGSSEKVKFDKIEYVPTLSGTSTQSVTLQKKRFDKRNKDLSSINMRNFLLDKFLKDKAPTISPQFKENLINSLEKFSYYSFKQFCQRVLEVALIASEDMCGTLVINERHFIEAAKFYFIRLNSDGVSDQHRHIPAEQPSPRASPKPPPQASAKPAPKPAPQAAPKNESGGCLLF